MPGDQFYELPALELTAKLPGNIFCSWVGGNIQLKGGIVESC